MESITALCHFGQGGFFIPVLDDDAVDGHHHAGAVCAVLTVQQHRLLCGVGGDDEKAHHVFVLGMPCVEFDVLIVQCGVFAQASVVIVKSTQVNQGFDGLAVEDDGLSLVNEASPSTCGCAERNKVGVTW